MDPLLDDSVELAELLRRHNRVRITSKDSPP
jgi:hypothetical protein